MPLVAALLVAGPLATLAGLSSHPGISIRWNWPGLHAWYVGDVASFKVTVTNTSRRPSPVMTVKHSSPGLTFPDMTLPALSPGESASVTVQLELGHRRGRVPLEWALTGRNRLVGLEVSGAPRANTKPLFAVRPRPELPPAPVLRLLTRPAEDGSSHDVRGSADPLQLRDFVSGDAVSSVHWRSTARAGRPVILERDRPSGTRLVLLVGGSGSGPAWEATLARAAGLVEAARTAEIPVSVVADAPAEHLPPTPGHDLVQDWIAGLGEVGPAQPALIELALQRAAGGIVAVASAEPLLVASVAQAAGGATVLDLAQPW